MLGAIEAGGTKFVCAVGQKDGRLVERIQINTDIPERTIPEVIAFFREFPIQAIGIASFGPIDINKESPTYGYIKSTPKPGWIDFPFVQTMEDAFHVPIHFTTDVDGAALGEWAYGAAKGHNSCLYMTVGTGIGAGAVVDGKLLRGLSHPEMGHISVRRHPEDSYEGFCPYHRDCIEGLAAGPAIEGRWGVKADMLHHEKAWEMEAYYLAEALVQYILILSPEKIIMGGGVMKQKHLFPRIHSLVKEKLAVFVPLPDKLVRYIVPPQLGDDAGVTGALLMAKQILEKKKACEKQK